MTTATVEDTANVTAIADALNQLVADSYGLMAQLHLAHWNVEGSDFFQLHEAFQSQYEELFQAIDEVAERVRAIDHYSMGGLKELASKSGVAEGPSGAACPARDFVASLIDGHEVCIATALAGRKTAAEAGDAETEDLLIGRIKTHQKAVWFFKSYLK